MSNEHGTKTESPMGANSELGSICGALAHSPLNDRTHRFRELRSTTFCVPDYAVLIRQIPGPALVSETMEPSPANSIPNRTIEHIEKFHLPSGRCRELRKTTVTLLDSCFNSTTSETIEVIPGLDCRCVPVDLHDLTECSECDAIICQSKHAGSCHHCGRTCCVSCLKETVISDVSVKLCGQCRRKLLANPIIKLLRMIWE